MKYLISLLFICATMSVAAQKKNKIAEKYAATINAADLSRHLYIIADPAMEGRETGMPGQRKAAAYLKQQFSDAGLQPGNKGSQEQMYPLYKDTLLDAAIMVGEQSFRFGTDFNIALNSINHTRQFFSEVVYLQQGDTVTDVRGRAVLYVAKDAQAPNMRDLQKLQGMYPAVIMIVQSGVEKLPASRSGRMYYNIFRPRVGANVVRISEAIAAAILGDDYANARNQSLPTKTYTRDVMVHFNKQQEVLQASNILAVVEGTDLKDEWVVITAHYDHVGIINGKLHPGADDDGSGTVGVLELAEAFAKAKAEGKGPRRSILFMTVSGEEKGLWGSDYYSRYPVYPLEKTTLNLNIDMIGRKDDNLKSIDSNNHVYVIGDDKLSSDLKPMLDSINKLYINIITDRKYNDPKDPQRLYYRSDHYNFAKRGVPIIFFFDGIHKDYHKPTDTPDKINYDLLEKRTRLVFYLAWEAANRNKMMVRDMPLEAVGTR